MRDKQKHNFGADEREADLLRDAEHDNADDALYKVPAQPATFPHCPYVPRATPCTPPPLPSPERRSSPPLPLAEPKPSRSRARLPPDADMTRTQPSHCPPPPFTPLPPLKPSQVWSTIPNAKPAIRPMADDSKMLSFLKVQTAPPSYPPPCPKHTPTHSHQPPPYPRPPDPHSTPNPTSHPTLAPPYPSDNPP